MLEIAEEIRKLIRLDSLDWERHSCKEELTAAPEQLAAEQRAFEDRRADRAATQADEVRCRKAMAEDEASLADVERRLDRARKRMPTIFTSTQIEATQREIANLTTAAGELEDRILARLEEGEVLAGQLAEQDRGLAESDSKLSARRQAWDLRLVELEARVCAIEAEREPIFGLLRSDVARRYQVGWNQARWKRRSGITSVKNCICTTCNCRVVPLWAQESREHSGLHACDTCKRIIAFDPDAASS